MEVKIKEYEELDARAIETERVINLSIQESIMIPGNSKSPKSYELPMDLRKPARSYTLHPISKFVSFNTLFTRFHALTTSLDRIEISKNIHEVLKILQLREAVVEEIKTMKKNRTWDVIEISKGKTTVAYK